MPSGSKKRKAAKKKMEKQSNNNPVGSSDVEGVRSNVITEANTMSEEVNVVRVERKFEIEDKHNEKGGRRANDKKKSSKLYDGGSARSSSSSSSSSNSDDEHHHVKTAGSLSRGKAEATNGSNVHRGGDSVTENVTDVVISEKIESPSIIESVSEENKEPIVSSSPDILETSVMDSASGQEETNILVEKIKTIFDQKESALHATNGQLNLSYNTPTTADENSSDRDEDSGVAVPLLDPAHTSWKSCCGLFELFNGSSR